MDNFPLAKTLMVPIKGTNYNLNYNKFCLPCMSPQTLNWSFDEGVVFALGPLSGKSGSLQSKLSDFLR